MLQVSPRSTNFQVHEKKLKQSDCNNLIKSMIQV